VKVFGKEKSMSGLLGIGGGGNPLGSIGKVFEDAASGDFMKLAKDALPLVATAVAGPAGGALVGALTNSDN
jgi:hypothetical protein